MTGLRTFASAYFSKSYWRYTFLTGKTATLAFAILGALFLPVELIAFFFPTAAPRLQAAWPYLLLAGLLFLLWKHRPLLSVTERLAGRDVQLEIRIADIFDVQAARIIGINTTFDTDLESGIISRTSLQGQFTRRCYGDATSLDAELAEKLAPMSSTTLPAKQRGKSARYEIGTVVRLTPNEETFYLVAIADMNNVGVASSTFDNIKTSLAAVWEFIIREGVGGLEPVAMPVLGSGNTRLTETREVIAREIIKSFVAACATRKFSEKFILVISPEDFRKHDINIYELRGFLRHVCTYTEFRNAHDPGAGAGIDENQIPLAAVDRKVSDAVESSASEILRAAASADGRVLIVAHMLGEYIKAGGSKYPENETRRDAALYKAAVQRLVEQSQLRPIGHKGEVFEVTHDGYLAAGHQV